MFGRNTDIEGSGTLCKRHELEFRWLLTQQSVQLHSTVGVVSALALVPAGAAGAIAFISEDPIRGIGGMALLGLNAILIVMSGVVTLLILKPNVQR